MKLLHISDLHIGKRLNEFSLLEDQEFILKEILEKADEISPDIIIIAGDIYDKSSPSAEAVSLFDKFLTALAERKLETYIISGNHDSPERLAFASHLIDAAGIHISPVYDGSIKPLYFEDGYGRVNIYMLPFIKPIHVRKYTDEEILSYSDALRFAVREMHIDKNARNILITHQFVTGSKRSDSEEISVGGTDNVDASVFSDFDYVALGHIHSPQNCTSPYIRYCGTPLKYSFSEVNDEKSITVVDMKEKGNIELSLVPLVPMRDMKEIRGNYSDIMQKSFYENTSYRTDYMRIVLTDEDEIADAAVKLRTVYKNLMEVKYDNSRTAAGGSVEAAEEEKKKSPYEHFCDFYHQQNNVELSPVQSEFVKELIEKVWEGE